MISQERLDQLHGAAIRVLGAGKTSPTMTGTLRVVDHEFPQRGQSLNLEVTVPAAKPVTLQLTRHEAELILATPAGREPEFRWNGKPRPLHLVSADDLIPTSREAHFV